MCIAVSTVTSEILILEVPDATLDLLGSARTIVCTRTVAITRLESGYWTTICTTTHT
jgi:hypothetical protein